MKKILALALSLTLFLTATFAAPVFADSTEPPIDINNATFTEIPDQILTDDLALTYESTYYDLLIITYNGRTLYPYSDYILTCGPNNTPGIGTVKIQGIGDFFGTKDISFVIKPPTPSIYGILYKKGAFAPCLISNGTLVKNFEVKYSEKGKNQWTSVEGTIKKEGDFDKSIKPKKMEKAYDVQVRSIYTSAGKTYYSDWSKLYTTRRIGTSTVKLSLTYPLAPHLGLFLTDKKAKNDFSEQFTSNITHVDGIKLNKAQQGIVKNIGGLALYYDAKAKKVYVPTKIKQSKDYKTATITVNGKKITLKEKKNKKIGMQNHYAKGKNLLVSMYEVSLIKGKHTITGSYTFNGIAAGTYDLSAELRSGVAKKKTVKKNIVIKKNKVYNIGKTKY